MTLELPVTVHDLDTPVGPGRAQVCRPRGARGLLALGHGAGPSLSTVDLLAARDAAVAQGWAVALLAQPWLVAGGRVAARPAVLDQAWVPMVSALRAGRGPLARLPGPLVVAGRSAGARVACRTATQLGAAGVLCLSFPLHPPGKPASSRADELLLPVAAGLGVYVVQGERDPFGTPEQVRDQAPGLAGLYPVAGSHTIPKGSAGSVREAVAAALGGIPRS